MNSKLQKTQQSSIYDVPVDTMDGGRTNLKAYEGKVMLLVNVASRCGFTSQYKELEAMHQEYREEGLAILGFPCNQFAQQEPGTDAEIKEFAESCYRVSFPLFAKIDVKGKNQAPLYAFIKKHIKRRPFKFIPWNFSKILVDPKGNVLKQYLPITPLKNTKRHRKLLNSI